MLNESNKAELAVATWRLERWVDNLAIDRKMAAKSSLRSIKKYLRDNEIEVVDLTGAKFDVGLAVSVVNNESDEKDEDKLLIREMVKPIIKEKGSVIQYGQVILGDEIKSPKVTTVLKQTTDLQNAPKPEGSGRESADESDVKTEEKTLSKEKSKKHVLFLSCLTILQVAILLLLVHTNQRVDSLNIATLSNANMYDNTKELVSKIGNNISNLDISITKVKEDLESSICNFNNKIENNTLEVNRELQTRKDEIKQIEQILANIDSNLGNVSKSIIELEKSSGERISGNEISPDSSDAEYIVYTVIEGDNMIKICSKNNIEYYPNKKIILKLNKIKDPNSIKVGQKLIIPKIKERN